MNGTAKSSTQVKSRQEGEQGTPTLLRLLCLAVMYRLVARIPLRIRQSIITICGLIELMWPLALWIAYSKAIF